jgi:hypothetical protein
LGGKSTGNTCDVGIFCPTEGGVAVLGIVWWILRRLITSEAIQVVKVSNGFFV